MIISFDLNYFRNSCCLLFHFTAVLVQFAFVLSSKYVPNENENENANKKENIEKVEKFQDFLCRVTRTFLSKCSRLFRFFYVATHNKKFEFFVH